MKDVTIYTTNSCPYCFQAKALLNKKGVKFTEIDVTYDRATRAAMSKLAHGRTTVPQIFIGGQHVGGCDDLYDLDDAGQLDPLLVAA
ncbi:MAG: glutaredoxin 3 [Aestuariivirga sp.]